jgi:hypothetical protein
MQPQRAHTRIPTVTAYALMERKMLGCESCLIGISLGSTGLWVAQPLDSHRIVGHTALGSYEILGGAAALARTGLWVAQRLGSCEILGGAALQALR